MRYEVSQRRPISSGANEITVAQLELVSSKVSFRLWQIKATVEYVVGKDEVSTKTATLQRKDIQSTKLVLIWQLSHAFDHTSGQALYALHQVDVSS